MTSIVRFIKRRKTRELREQQQRASQRAAEYLNTLTAHTQKVHGWDRAAHN